jgi:hypothetical protein
VHRLKKRPVITLRRARFARLLRRLRVGSDYPGLIDGKNAQICAG